MDREEGREQRTEPGKEGSGQASHYQKACNCNASGKKNKILYSFSLAYSVAVPGLLAVTRLCLQPFLQPFSGEVLQTGFRLSQVQTRFVVVEAQTFDAQFFKLFWFLVEVVVEVQVRPRKATGSHGKPPGSNN